jgi:hypothetical protein
MSKNKKQNNMKETAKVCKINNLDNLNERELIQYNRIIKALGRTEDRYGKASYKEVKNMINRANRKGTVYTTTDRNAVFRYIHDMKYTIDIVAKYNKRGGYKQSVENNSKQTSLKTICIVDIYVVVRETKEVIYIDGHAWLNTDLALEAGKYFYEYGDMEGGMVFVSRLKAMKYKSDYKANGYEVHKYQLSSLSKTKRASWVQRWQKSVGINMTIDEIRAML